MAYRNSKRATAEINWPMQNLGKFMIAENSEEPVDESLWRTVRPFVSCNTRNHEGATKWSFNQDAIDRNKKVAGGFTLLTNMYDQPWSTLDPYRQRNRIEMGFDWLKNEVKGSKLFISEKVFKGMLFTRILDQMLRSALYNAVVKAGIWVDRSTAKLGHEIE